MSDHNLPRTVSSKTLSGGVLWIDTTSDCDLRSAVFCAEEWIVASAAQMYPAHKRHRWLVLPHRECHRNADSNKSRKKLTWTARREAVCYTNPQGAPRICSLGVWLQEQCFLLYHFQNSAVWRPSHHDIVTFKPLRLYYNYYYYCVTLFSIKSKLFLCQNVFTLM